MNETFLGFDFGARRIGIALGASGTGARPLATIPNRGGTFDWRPIERAVADWTPAAFVVGVPYNADGSAHAVTRAAQRFAAELGSRFGLPVHMVDERYSSLEAERALAERRQRGDHRRVRKEEIDAAAAAVILAAWLEGGVDG